MNNEFKPSHFNDDENPRVFISGRVLSERDYDNYADITEDDLEAIRGDWQKTVPKDFKNLLDAE